MNRKNPILILSILLILAILAGCAGGVSTSPSAEPSASTSLAATAVTLTFKKDTLAIGETGYAQHAFTPEGSADPIVGFASSDEAVATVDAQGVITAIAAGKCTITITTQSGLTASAELTVTADVQALFIRNAPEKTAVGESFYLRMEDDKGAVIANNITFESDKADIASVDGQGKVTALSPGEVLITAKYKDKSASVKITVVESTATKLVLSESSITLTPGEEKKLAAEITQESGDLGKILWSSNDEKIASVDQTGKITAAAVGSATITAQISKTDIKATCKVTVKEAQASVPSSPSPALPALPAAGELPASRYRLDGTVYKMVSQRGEGRAVIQLVGDLMCLAAQQNGAKSGKGFNFESSFTYMPAILKKSDLAIGNLETLIAESSPITSVEKTIGGLPHCNGPEAYLRAVRKAGFDTVVTANNHSCDAGVQGLHETGQQLGRYNLPYTGTFPSADTQRYLLFDVNGIRVALLSYSEIFNGKDSKFAEKDKILLNLFTSARVKKDVAAAKAAGAEYIIAYNHWGIENTHDVTAEQKASAKIMADAGVDLIAGSHPHVLQQAEKIKASDGHEVLCFYSLGNFVSSMQRDINNDTIIAQITLTRKDGKIVLENAGYIPCKVFHEDVKGHHVVVPTSPALNGGRSGGSLTAAHARIVKVIGSAIDEITVLP